jgi:hypothetical protein
MKFTQDGEWMVGTPIVAVGQRDVSAALTCFHLSWKEECREVKQGVLMVMERCSTCLLATRGRYRPQKEGESA